MSQFHSYKSKEILIFGYIRNYYNGHIPSDLIKSLFLRFYDNTIYWIFEGDELNKFYECGNRAYLAGPRYKIYDIEFENTLCPNGWYIEDDGFVTFFIELKKLPKYIMSATIEYILYCKEINYSYKRCIVYHKEHKNAHGWGAYSVALSRFTNNNNEKYKILHFGCSIDVIHIEYEYTTKQKYKNFITPIPPISDITFTWNINGKLFDKFKNAATDELFYSDTFGNKCWFLMCKPMGSRTNGSEGCLQIALRLLRLPFNQKSIHIKYTIKSNIDQYIYNKVDRFEMNSNWKDLSITMFLSSILKRVPSVSFTVIIEMVDVIDSDGLYIADLL